MEDYGIGKAASTKAGWTKAGWALGGLADLWEFDLLDVLIKEAAPHVAL
jgi:hypothetical protein